LPPILPPMSSCCRWKAQTSLYSSLSFVPTTKSEQVSYPFGWPTHIYEGVVISECNVLDSSIFCFSRKLRRGDPFTEKSVGWSPACHKRKRKKKFGMKVNRLAQCTPQCNPCGHYLHWNAVSILLFLQQRKALQELTNRKWSKSEHILHSFNDTHSNIPRWSGALCIDSVQASVLSILYVLHALCHMQKYTGDCVYR